MFQSRYFVTVLIVNLAFLATFAKAQDQIISATLSSAEIASGEQVTVAVSYGASDNSLTTGLGLRLHFDSSKLSTLAVANLLADNIMGAQFSDDINDYDNDSSTDRFYNTSWASFSGATWPPGVGLPTTLYSLSFTAKADFTDTTINFSRISGPVGFGFVADRVTIYADAKPVVTAPEDITVAADNAAGTSATNSSVSAFLAAATAVDNVDGNISVTNNAKQIFPIGDTQVTFSATDSLGNRGTAVAVVTVVDKTAPVIDVPPSITVLGSSAGAEISAHAIVELLNGVSAEDNVDGTLTSSISNDAPSLFPLGQTSVTFSVSDAAGNLATSITIVTVNLDIQAPVLTVPSPITLYVNMPEDSIAASNVAVANFLAAASATDDRDGDVTGAIVNNVPAEFSVGNTEIIFTVADSLNNIATEVSSIRVEVLDSDSDGLPDFFENANGLDPNDASDASADLDGDGISNIDEYTAGSDPGKDELPPVLTVPADIMVDATGRLTAVDLGEASAVDNKDGDLKPSASNLGPFTSGQHEIIWTARDAAANASQDKQVVVVKPLVNMTPSTVVTEGSVLDIKVILSGNAADYPVTIPLIINGTALADKDFSLSTQSIVIESGILGHASLSILSDSETESSETIEISLGVPTNAALGSVVSRKITIVEENIAPKLVIDVTQNEKRGRVIDAEGGTVTIKASYTDLNDADAHTLEWGSATSDLPEVVISGPILTFNPSGLGENILTISAKVSDDGNPVLTSSKSVLIKVLAEAPILDSSNDTDGDGVSDAEEGFDDSDNDGIPDYQDNISEPYLAPIGNNTSKIMQAPPGTSIILGDSAFAAGNNSVGLSEEQLKDITGIADKDFDFPNGLVDFKISGDVPGATYSLVLPLASAIPNNAVFRKYIDANIGWREYKIDGNNAIASSSSSSSGATCPEPGSDLYGDGLKAGDFCIQLSIEDGGPNDADGLADGMVTDPGGVAILYFGPPSAGSTVELSVTELKANGSDSATVTVTALDSDGRLLEGMVVTASASISDVVIDSFEEQGKGIYTATLTTGKNAGSMKVTATIDNGEDDISVVSSAVEVKSIGGGGGGCTVGTGQSPDTGILLLILGLLLMVRRRLKRVAKFNFINQ